VVAEFWEFNLGSAFSPKTSPSPWWQTCMLDVKMLLRCKNDTDLFHHCAAFGRAGTSHSASERQKSFVFLYVDHALNGSLC